MSQPMRVAGISGSVRHGSYNRALLDAIVALAPESLRIERAEIGGLPFYDPNLEGAAEPAPAATFRQAVGAADGLLIVTPEYNYGIPGVLKNAIDWGSRSSASAKSVLGGRKVGIAGASPGMFGSIRAQTQLRAILHGAGANAMFRPEVAVAAVDKKFDDQGQLTDATTREHLIKFLAAFEVFLRG